jgi:hypothetical protein
MARKQMNQLTHLMLGGGYFLEIITTPSTDGTESHNMCILVDVNNPDSEMVSLEAANFDDGRVQAINYLRRMRGLSRLLGEIDGTK